jgi:hypothetical protein
VNRSAAVFGVAATGTGILRPGSAVASNTNSDHQGGKCGNGGNGSQSFTPQSPLRPAARPASVRFPKIDNIFKNPPAKLCTFFFWTPSASAKRARAECNGPFPHTTNGVDFVDHV